MISALLDKYFCAVDKIIDTGHIATTNYKTIYRLILFMLFITSWCQPLKTDPSREICTYAHSVAFFAKCAP